MSPDMIGKPIGPRIGADPPRRNGMSPPDSQSIRRVMLIDLNWRQTGYLAAAMHDAGIETLIVSTGRPDRIGLGHYCAQVKSPHYTSPQYVPYVREQINRFRPDCVIPLCEPLLELFWKLEPPCSPPIYPSTEPWQREIILDRRRLYELATAAGVPIPPWRPIETAADLDWAMGQFGFPLVIRGTSGFGGDQVRIVDSPHQAQAAIEKLKKISPKAPFAQAFIRGRRQSIGGVFVQGEMIRSFTQEVTEEHPPRTGPSTKIRTMNDKNLEDQTRSLFGALRWSGIASADFIRNEEGVFVLMEVNPRPWGSIAVAERMGAQICRTFAQLLAGKPIASEVAYETGVECIVLENFVLARRQDGVWSTLRALKLRDKWGCALAVPWRRPRLALHVVRWLYRALDH